LTDDVPDWLRSAAAVAWRLLVVGAAIYFGWQVLQRISVVVIAAVLALFPASLLWGPVKALKRWGWKPLLATWTVLLVSAAFLVGIGFLVVPALIDGLEPLGQDLAAAYDDFLEWLTVGPLGLSEAEVNRYSDTLVAQLQDQLGNVGSGVLSGAAFLVEAITGLVLALIVAFFVLKDGDRVAYKLFDRLSPTTADRVRRGGRVAWTTLSRYVKGLALVGLIDATAIAIGLLILGVPLVAPLAILVFIGAFLPVVGAFVSGLFAVAVALVNGGLTQALIVLAIVVAVQQLEGDVILPLIFGRSMEMHPLVILLAIAIGGVAFGIVGAFLSVPIAAVVIAVNQELAANPDDSLISLAKKVE
jgi:putative heme transporter